MEDASLKMGVKSGQCCCRSWRRLVGSPSKIRDFGASRY